MSQSCRAGLLATEQSCTGMEGLKDGEMGGWLDLISSRSKKMKVYSRELSFHSKDDKDLVHEFVVAEGLICLVKVGAEADQNYQNYILRGITSLRQHVLGRRPQSSRAGLPSLKAKTETKQDLPGLHPNTAEHSKPSAKHNTRGQRSRLHQG
ncbi:FH1/FH2 domain-containing protein 3 isoform X1 [Tachysurus ichikawai]